MRDRGLENKADSFGEGNISSSQVPSRRICE